MDYIYYSQRCSANRGCSQYGVLADDAFFSVPLDTNSGGKQLLEQGIQLSPTGVTNPYDCNDLEYKQNLATVDYFFGAFKDDRLLTKISSGGEGKNAKLSAAVSAGVQAEKAFFDASYPSDDALDQLGETYAHVYAVASRENLLDSAVREQLLFRSSLIKEKTSQLDASIREVMTYLEDLNINVAKSPASVAPSLSYDYATRSSYALFFLNDSSAVWRSAEKPAYKLEQSQQNSMSQGLHTFVHFQQAEQQYGLERLNTWRREVLEMKNKRILGT
jgi:hypothetical protein